MKSVNKKIPDLNSQMVTLAYQRAVPATLMTQWTLATIKSRKHQAVVMAVQEISLTIITARCFWLFMVATVHCVNSVAASTALW